MATTSKVIYDTLVELRASAALTANVDGTGQLLYAYGLNKAVAIVTAKSGTSPTLDIKIQECATLGGSYTDIAAFAQITAVGSYELVFRAVQPYIRYSATVGGTTPSFTTWIIVTTPDK